MAPERLHLPAGLEGRAWAFATSRDWRPPLPLHRHRELEINLVIAGTASYLVAEHRVPLRSGSLLWLFPGQDHVLLNVSMDFRMWIVVFRPALVRRACTSSASALLRRNDPGQVFCRTLEPARFHELDELCGAIARTGEADVARHNAGLGYLLLSAWAMHRAVAAPPAVHVMHPAVERAALILRDEAEPLDVPALAMRCGLSTSRLSRLFRQQTGVSLTQYRNRRRLERFVELYGRGQRLNITEAALAAGFGSYPQFHRVFRQLTGRSPAAYRRLMCAGG